MTDLLINKPLKHLARAQVANQAFNEADNTAVNYIYLRADEIVTNTIAGLANPIDPLLIDVLIMRLDYLNRLLVNADTNSQTDELSAWSRKL